MRFLSKNRHYLYKDIVGRSGEVTYLNIYIIYRWYWPIFTGPEKFDTLYYYAIFFIDCDDVAYQQRFQFLIEGGKVLTGPNE